MRVFDVTIDAAASGTRIITIVWAVVKKKIPLKMRYGLRFTFKRDSLRLVACI